MYKPRLGRWVIFVGLCLLSSVSSAQTPPSDIEANTGYDNPPLRSPDEAIDEVLIIGEQAGPSMWRVYKDDHVLWVLGTLSPLSKGMQWHSKQVDEALTHSQEFITPPELRLELGFWSKVGVLPSLIGIKNNPEGKTLEEVLPPDLYQHWVALKEKYMDGKNDVEKRRPIFAATELYKQSIAKSGLVKNDDVRWRIEGIVRNNKIPTTKPQVLHEFQNPRAAIKKFKKTSLDDTECFRKILTRLETDLGAMKSRANAWAIGDIPALQSLPFVDDQETCEAAVLNSEMVQEQGLQDAKLLMRNAWIEAAETALTNNASSFATLPIEELLKPDNYLTVLKSKGYKVELPY